MCLCRWLARERGEERRNDLSKYLSRTEAQALDYKGCIFLYTIANSFTQYKHQHCKYEAELHAYVSANIIPKTNSGRWGPAADWTQLEQKSSIPVSSLTFHMKSKQSVKARSRGRKLMCLDLCICVRVRLCVHSADPWVSRSHFDLCVRDSDTPPAPIAEAWESCLVFILTFQSTYHLNSLHCTAQLCYYICLHWQHDAAKSFQRGRLEIVSFWGDLLML